MNLKTTMCHATLLSMLFMPERFSRAVRKYNASAPDIEHEGFNGYMETHVEFEIKDLDEFNSLWKDAAKVPTDRTEWYWKVRNGHFKSNN